jgi:hypothetical protein
MTLGTRLRIAERLMVGIHRTRIIRAMTIDAIGRKGNKLIVHMAIRTCYSAMGTGQRKSRIVVRERRWLPRHGCVTCSAICIKLRQLVVRLGCSLKLRLMAGGAVGRRARERSGLMTQRARCHNVCSGQREGCRRMVKSCTPRERAHLMARFTGCREARESVIWVRRIFKVGHVATVAHQWSSGVLVVRGCSVT